MTRARSRRSCRRPSCCSRSCRPPRRSVSREKRRAAISATARASRSRTATPLRPRRSRPSRRCSRRAESPFADAGIVGRGPAPGGERTRFYVSGRRAAPCSTSTSPRSRWSTWAGARHASALKMAYAALNKGMDALHAAVLLAGCGSACCGRCSRNSRRAKPKRSQRMRARVPFLAATAARFTGRDGRDRGAFAPWASRRIFIAAPSGSTRCSRRRRSPRRRVGRAARALARRGARGVRRGPRASTAERSR